ncbi:hypothetical protein LSAT2_022761 [Lamellibrachia satsuma]|nr:hypothetical protein LSAT2_022761 [Lamellibrachia satsuma]
MNLFLVCIAIIAFSSASEEKRKMLHLKRLHSTIERSETRVIKKRYLYQNGRGPSPSVDKSRPGEMWIDLQMDQYVMRNCPDCRFFVAFQCVSDDCHNKHVRKFPCGGFDWKSFVAQFDTPGHYDGAWVSGLEDGRKYEVWDLVTLADKRTPYTGYTNEERRTVVIPQEV